LAERKPAHYGRGIPQEFAEDTSWRTLISPARRGGIRDTYRSKGPTGVAVRTLIEFIERSGRQDGN